MRLRDIAPLVFVVIACSMLNREGPNVTCADLGDGATNACADGIIATCSAGEMRWRVCEDEKACEQSWQVDGGFRCAESDPVPSPGPSGGSGGGAGAGGSGGGSGGNAGNAGTGGGAGATPAVAFCGSCPTGYMMVATACNTECGACGCEQHLCASNAQYAAGMSLAQNSCKQGEHSILSVPDCLPGCTSCGTRLLCVVD